MFPLILMVMASAVPMLEAKPFAKKITNSTKAAFGPLTFKGDGTFQIAVFEDLHFGENAWDQWGPQQDINSVKVINEILEAESPGLVVLNGDLITGENTFLENSTTYVDQIVGPLVNRGLTWASTYGNHDYDFNISGSTILAREKLWPNSRTQQMVNSENSGVSNYYLPVYDSECSNEGCAPELLLWFFDSKGGYKYQQKNASGSHVGNPDWVDFSVVDWFLKTNNELVSKFNKAIPSLAFVHIPTYASSILQQQGVDPHAEPGINDDNPLAPQAQGWCSDGRNDGTCTYGGQDIPFMQAISTVPGLIAVFSGHDHGDSWCDKWDRQLPGMTVAPQNDVILCFSQHSGYGGYGNWERGSRQLLVSKAKLQEGAVDTWIRLESGNVAGSVTLNSTFGRDQYPATNNTKTYCPTCDYSST
ncbi:Metallo-dependent phosphatase [Annulohypoxylon truncatum]|uniref:Metallo-dependent phosphatase n=1 Tax=Annulohypoxylon truncatum TaxID=327061 RepID=UPI00200817C4|nr:Metallo-dependent phosphatase [Annulohypoxylon truncatum]KAI1206916.1 Metallo-dependent phosphatase [Annulohypoxylon truncatum]